MGTLCVTRVDPSPSVGTNSACVLQPVRISASAASAASSGLGTDLSDTGLICSFTGSISRAHRTGGSTRARLGNRQKPGCPRAGKQGPEELSRSWESLVRATPRTGGFQPSPPCWSQTGAQVCSHLATSDAAPRLHWAAWPEPGGGASTCI